jgi:nucleoside-diphosphate-sugar epimerase
MPRSIADPHSSFESNVVLTEALEAGCRRVVYASSSSVYGNTPQLPKREGMTPRPMSPHAVSNLSAEQLCQVFTQVHGLETVSLRYFNVFGPRQNCDSQYAAAVPRILSAFAGGGQPTIHGDCEQSRSFTYIDNVVDGNLRAGWTTGVAGLVMNFASDQSYSVNPIARSMASLLGVECRPRYQPSRISEVKNSFADITLARHRLGWERLVSFEDGLARTVAAFVYRPAVSAARIA